MSAGNLILRILGALCAALGFLAWIGLAWRGLSDLDTVSAHSEEGGRLMVWALTGTVLMIVGTVILHVAVDTPEREEQDEREHPR